MVLSIPSTVQGGLRKYIPSVSSSSVLVRSRRVVQSTISTPLHLLRSKTKKCSPKKCFLSTSTNGGFDDVAISKEKNLSVSMDALPPNDVSVGPLIDILPPEISPSRSSILDDRNFPPLPMDGAFLRKNSENHSHDSNSYRRPLLRVSPTPSPVEDTVEKAQVNFSDIVDRLLNRKKSPSVPGAVPSDKVSATQALSRLSWRENLWKASNRQQASSVDEHLYQQGETSVPTSTWVLLENVSPISSLQAMLQGIQDALDAEEIKGIVDLDKGWINGENLPLLDLSTTPVVTAKSTNDHKWVRKAKLVLSPFGRPTGWYLQFDSRSIVYALLSHSKENTIRCSWREVRVREYKGKEENGESDDPTSQGNWLLNEFISDNTLRVENCPYDVSEASMLNFFSRYDLKPGCKAIELWHGVTIDGKVCPPTTYLVHFADASWARAALREKQNTYMYKLGEVVKDFKNPKPLRLVQYPRQML